MGEMSRYIDADNFERACMSDKNCEDMQDVIYKLRDYPTADVAEVVRCKDCKHHEELLNNNDENVLCWVHDIDVIVDRNGYCNYGERKEQEDEV